MKLGIIGAMQVEVEQLVAQLARVGSRPPPAAWPTGQVAFGVVGKGAGGPGLGGGVCMSRPPTCTSLEGRGRRAHLCRLPVFLLSHPHTPPV